MKKKSKYLIVIGIIAILCCVILYFSIYIFSQIKLNGRWYLYNGNDINTESNLSDNLNEKTYVDITKDKWSEYQSNGKNGFSAYTIKGNQLYVGDSIYAFDISKVGEYKILSLKTIGSNMGNKPTYFEDGNSYTYVLGYYEMQ